MKYSDLPNICRVPHIQVNGCENEDDDNWPLIDDSYSPPGLTRQGSASCEVLSWIEENPHNMNGEEPTYVTVAPHPVSTGRSRGISRDGDYVYLRPVARKAKCTSLDKDPEEDDFVESGPRQGITDVALRKLASDRRSGVPSRVYEVLYDFEASNLDELNLKAGDTVTCIMDKTGETGWFYGEKQDGEKGLIPENFVKLIGDGPRQIRKSQVDFGLDDQERCLLGRGGCADVYRVVYKGHMAALKIFRKTATKPDPMAAVRQEAILINRLKHPNIIELYGMCLDHPNIGLVLELCEGKSLKNMLTHVEKNNIFVSVRFMVDWAVQIATAMEFLTDNNILHRDLKAENVLVKERICYCDRINDYDLCQMENCKGHTVKSKLTLKVTDFGTTKERESEDDKRTSSHMVGTYSWMAPEAFRVHQYTEASDVWSFGVVLWEILTKKVPYEGVGPIIAAFNVVKNGSMLEVDSDCPLKWKSIMKGCWAIDPANRPTFKQIKTEMTEYKHLLEADGVSVEEEERVEKTQREIMDIITNFRDNPHATNEYNTYYEKLYKKIATVSEMIDPTIPVDTKDNKKAPPRRRLKIKKADISAPQDTRHISSIRPTSTSPHGGNSLQIILPPGRSTDSGSSPGSDFSGTLPRIPRKPMDSHESHPALSNVLSISSPNLNQIMPIQDGNSTLKRKDAIKRKNKNSIVSSNASVETLPDKFANVTVVDARFVNAIGTPVRRPSGGGKIADGSRKSEEAEHKEHKSLFSRFIPIFKSRTSRSIEDNGEDPQSAGTVLNSARASTSSSKGLAGFSHMIRGPANLNSLDRSSPQSRQRVTSNTYLPPDEERYTRNYKKKSSPTEEVSRNSSPYVAHRPLDTPSRHRTIGIDEAIPSPSEISGIMETQHQQQRNHQRTPSDGVRIPEFPRNTPAMSPPSHSAPKLAGLGGLLELSTVIPAVDDDIPFDNPYVICGPIPPGVSNTAISNSPYIQMPAKIQGLHGMTNDQYFNCSVRPERPDTLPFKSAVTPESSGISTGGSSAFSSISFANDVPTIQAPAPPPLLSRPPAIPPREGSIGLPVQSALS